MRGLLIVFFCLSLSLSGCVDEPECPEEDDTICSCDDGTEGELQCSDGEATCICDGDDSADQ